MKLVNKFNLWLFLMELLLTGKEVPNVILGMVKWNKQDLDSINK